MYGTTRTRCTPRHPRGSVGPKLAARIITELKDKIVTIPTVDMAKELDVNMNPQTEANSVADVVLAQQDDPNKLEDAISALVNLGYQRLEAYKAVNQAALNNPEADMSTLIKLALREFANKD